MIRIPITLFLLLIPALLSAQERNLSWVLDRYVEAAGGRVNLNDLNSIVIEGTLTVAEQNSFSIKVMKKRSNLVRQVMEQPDGRRITVAYNGETVWQINSDRRNEHFRVLTDKDASDFIRESPLENPLAAEGIDKSRFTYKGTTTIEDDSECHHIVVSYEDGTVTDYFLDVRTFLEKKTVKKVPQEDGSVQTTESFPSDFQFFDGVLFAQRLVIKRDDGYASVLTIDHIRINAGVPTSLFNPPPGY